MPGGEKPAPGTRLHTAAMPIKPPKGQLCMPLGRRPATACGVLNSQCVVTVRSAVVALQREGGSGSRSGFRQCERGIARVFGGLTRRNNARDGPVGSSGSQVKAHTPGSTGWQELVAVLQLELLQVSRMHCGFAMIFV